MSQYDNTNRGCLFVNDRKAQANQPDMKGKININGVDHWISGWWKNTARGEILSLALGEPVNQPAAQQARGRGRPVPIQSDDGFDDSTIPF